MAINYKLVTATSDASSPDTVFTATAVATHVKSVRIANESGGALTYHLAVYDNSASIEVPITVPATSLPDDDVDVMVEPFNLQNGDYIKLYSSGAGVKVAITLAENTDTAGASSSDDLPEGVTNLYLTSSERTKLSGIATGAEVNQNAFSNFAVSGQTTVAADTNTDTLTLVAGTNITLTTDAGTDSITIAASGGGGTPAGSTGYIQYNTGGAFDAEAALYYDATNNRLSVGGDTTPAGTITSRGAGTTTGTTFLCEDSAGTARLEILDSGRASLTSAAVANAPSFSVLSGAPSSLSGGISLRRSDASHTLAAGNAQSTDTFFLVRTEAAPAVYATIMGLSASGQASPPATRWIGIHGSTAPTGAVFTMQGSKTNGSTGYTTLGNAETAWKFDNFATNLLVCLGSGAFGIRNSAPTSTTALTVRGQGTSTNTCFRCENNSGTVQFTIRDDGGFAFTGGTVGAAQTGYTTFTNLTTDRTCDANATTVEELADILGTLIVDLKTKGIIAA